MFIFSWKQTVLHGNNLYYMETNVLHGNIFCGWGKLFYMETNMFCYKKMVHLSKGEALPYENLVLATGSRVRQLEVEGSDLKNINSLNLMAQVRAGGNAIHSHLHDLGVYWNGIFWRLFD